MFKNVIKVLDLISAKKTESLERTPLQGIFLKTYLEGDGNYFFLTATDGLMVVKIQVNALDYHKLYKVLKETYKVNLPKRIKSGYFFLNPKTQEEIKKEYPEFIIKNFYLQDVDNDEKKYPDCDKFFEDDYPDQDELSFSDYPTFSFETLKRIERIYKLLKIKKPCFCPDKIKDATHGTLNEYILDEEMNMTMQLIVMPLRYRQ